MTGKVQLLGTAQTGKEPGIIMEKNPILQISARLDGQDLGSGAGSGLVGTTFGEKEVVIEVKVDLMAWTYSVNLSRPSEKAITNFPNIKIGERFSIKFAGNEISVLTEEIDKFPAEPPTTRIADATTCGGWSDPC